MKNLYEQLVRPLLFSLEAETAHHFTIASLRWASDFDPALHALSEKKHARDLVRSRLFPSLVPLYYPRSHVYGGTLAWNF